MAVRTIIASFMLRVRSRLVVDIELDVGDGSNISCVLVSVDPIVGDSGEGSGDDGKRYESIYLYSARRESRHL
jgi:hypothetical protein